MLGSQGNAREVVNMKALAVRLW